MNNKNFIKSSMENKRGVYLWTNIIRGKQYIASSNNLGNRLNDYFRHSYIKTQTKRSSIICRALEKHGYSNFSLSIQVLGPRKKGTIFSKENLPDYVVLEQYYLTNYVLKYNVNRTARSAAYSPSTKNINKNSDNASYGIYDQMAFAWDNRHIQEIKEAWSNLNKNIYLNLIKVEVNINFMFPVRIIFLNV